jgi:hypothetical protein
MTDQTTPDTGDPTVSQAFALGWQMAELFRPQLRYRAEHLDGDLPGLGSLSNDQRREISVDQVQAGITELTPAIQQVGLSVPTTALGNVRTALGDWENDGQQAVMALHLKLLGTLTAADFRLGKAYGLGRALADTCRKPTDADSLKQELGKFRIANLLAWLDELSTALPPHAAHSVYTSLSQWRDWAENGQLPLAASDTIKRQGELWRALLSGEKRGTEILEIGNYLQAAAAIAGRMSSIVWKAVVRFWWVMIIVAGLIIAAVVLFIIGGGSQIVAGAGSLVVAFGVSWASVGKTLEKLAGKLEQPLWGAVLDTAIADAITLNPDNKADELGRAALASDIAAGSERAEGAESSNENVDATASTGT